MTVAPPDAQTGGQTGGRWKLVFGILNLTDELYPIGGNSSLGTGSGYAEIAYARQRQWFLTLDYSF